MSHGGFNLLIKAEHPVNIEVRANLLNVESDN